MKNRKNNSSKTANTLPGIGGESYQLITPPKPKKPKIKMAGHLVDNKLKYNYPRDLSIQGNLFDSLENRVKNEIDKDRGIKREHIIEGINLTPSETKLVDCLCELLHNKSQTLDSTGEDYYKGDAGFDLIAYGNVKETPAPKITTTLYELTKKYKGGDYVTGKDIKNVLSIAESLERKRFLLRYVETWHKQNGRTVEEQIQEYCPLIKLALMSKTVSFKGVEESKIMDYVIRLNPIFIRQIDSKYILYPTDLNRRTITAYGSHNVSNITFKLRDYLAREHSSKHYSPEIYLDRLYYQIAEKWMYEGRKKKVKEYTEKALETVKTLGLLIDYEYTTGATGETKIQFQLNKDWE